MHSLPSLPRTLPLALPCLAVMVLAMVVLTPGTALAEHALPDVSGQREADAVRRLEALALDVRIVTVAGVTPGRVASQEPAAGSPVEAGDEVVLRVGVLMRILTHAPRVVGLTERRAVDGLAEAYDLAVAYVDGPAHLQGRVLAQDPVAGAEVPFRGAFTIRVVRNRIVVPALVGTRERVAVQRLEAAGFEVQLRRVRTSFANQGTVIGQSPRPGARLEAGATVELEIAGRAQVGGARPVRVPDVTQLSMNEAEDELLTHGLSPHVHLVAQRAGVAPWTVVSQEVSAGRQVPEGTHVGVDVAAPTGLTGRMRVPSLHGQDLDHARALLEHMQATITLVRAPSRRAPGTVLAQTPNAGTFMLPGTAFRLTVATKPGSGWAAPQVAVPNLGRMAPAQARVALLQAGFTPHLHRDLGPDQPLGRVFRQEPAAGARARQGSEVTYVIPLTASVPDLEKLTREQALNALQQAGLQGLAKRHGPQVFGGISEVYRQSQAAGHVIARGSLVSFRYRMVPAIRQLKRVPNVVGLTREAAKARLVDVGFKPRLVAASIGTGATQVISQSPVAGSMRPAGHQVTATFRHRTQVLPPYSAVPRVVGMTQAEAARRLEALGFVVRGARQSAVTLGITRVIAQNPIAGTNRPRGSVVTLTYRVTPPVGHTTVVPSLVGQRFDKALDALRRAGFSAEIVGIGTKVRSQSPSAGTRVATGSKVRIRLR